MTLSKIHYEILLLLCQEIQKDKLQTLASKTIVSDVNYLFYFQPGPTLDSWRIQHLKQEENIDWNYFDNMLMYTKVLNQQQTTTLKSHMWLEPLLTTRTVAPKHLGGRLCLNLALTTPLLPCGLVTFPQITRILLAGFFPLASLFLWARYTYATRLPR